MDTKIIIIDRRLNNKFTSSALEELDEQLRMQGAQTGYTKYWDKDNSSCQILIGEAKSRLVEMLHTHNKISSQSREEGVLIHKCGIDGINNILVVAGTDNRGLLYAIYELADRIRCKGLPALEEDICIEEYPENKVRGVDKYIMNHLDEEWFHSRDYWERYLNKLGHCRFNRLTLITGFDTAYMTPPYPFFVKVNGFEDVAVDGLSERKRRKNLEMLNFIADTCEEKGIDFSFGSWQQMPWTKTQKSVIKNMPSTVRDFTAYCSKGIKTLVKECPNMKAIQFRVNMESGMAVETDQATNTNEAFWYSMIDAIASTGRRIRLDIRAKGVTDDLINYGLNKGLDITVTTKYWCEHAALPYHISKLRKEELDTIENMNSSRRYSYGDLLRRPHWYDMIYRLWNYGSINLFLWGDADYCRRFSKSLHMGDGIGFEVNSPLSLKGGMEDLAAEKPWGIHIHPDMVNYQYEDDRYWAFYLMFGRYGYCSDTDYSVVLREFEYRFQEDSVNMLAAYESASKVMPLITTVHFPVHPSLHYWPELFSGAALFAENNYETYFGKIDYAHALPSDEELFYSIADFVKDKLSGSIKPKYTPFVYRDWLHELSGRIRLSLHRLTGIERGSEAFSSIIDFSMLADIAEFHAWKIGAAYYLEMFYATSDTAYLAEAYAGMVTAMNYWEQVSTIGNKYYNNDLEFNAGTGTKRHKNWQDRLVVEIRKDVQQLEKLLSEHKLAGQELKPDREYVSLGGAPKICFIDKVPEVWEAGRELKVELRAQDGSVVTNLEKVYLNYRHTNHIEGEYNHILLERQGISFTGSIPAQYITEDFDLIVYFSAVDKDGNTYIYPGVYHPKEEFPYHVVRIVKQ
jgi:hypothetical protein